MTAVSCDKDSQETEVPPVTMEYFSLNDKEIKANAPGFSIDVNHDGRKDLAFTTQLVGDPLFQVDKLQFLVSTNIQVNLPVNSSEEIPIMSKGASIMLENFNGYEWFELSSILLVQKVLSNTAPPVWEGPWRNAAHKYLPYQVLVNGKRFNGWVELTVDITGQRIILHKAAVSTIPDKIIKAGE